jgi:signal transduction histidine kinase
MLRNNKSVVSTKGIRNEGGTGLGLSIVKDLISLHHGKMEIKSSEGVGTIFTINLVV